VAGFEAIARAAMEGSRATGGAATTADDQEICAFVQKRVAAFGLLLGLLLGGLLVWRVVVTLTIGADSGEGTYLYFHAGGVVTFLVMWLALRGQPRTARFVRVVELGGLAISCAFAAVMGLYLPYIARPDYILLLAFTFILIGRSVFVPSRAAITVALGALVCVLLLAATFAIHLRGYDPALYPSYEGASPLEVALRVTSGIGLWWLTTVALAAACARVIYGLRAEVRDARRLGQYTLHEKIGQGGMGEVYRASHALLRRPTAVKLLPPGKLGEESVARFEREVQLTARLSHPNTVRVFDYGRTPDRVFYYAMEYLEGATLARIVEVTGPMPAARVIQLLEQCAGALAEAHGIGLIHRDIKPANVLLTEQGGVPDVAKVVDFGLVKEVPAKAPSGTEKTLEAITRDDSVFGTPQYMAPESIRGAEVDARADLYALGAVGYYLLTGEDVFSGGTVLEVCSHHLQSAPVPVSERLGAPVPADLESVVMRCLEKEPDDRFADARALRDALRACADAGGWSEDDARAWWDRHRAAVRGAAGAAAVTGAIELDRTTAIDQGRVASR
jgi:eukaryotic-like serine/threonine-protein kinase